MDAETGLYYYGARYYDPRTSMWLSVDPLAEKYAGISPYSFCVNNPVRLVDPNGMDWFETTNEDGSKSVKWNKSTGQNFSDESGKWRNIGNSYSAKISDGSSVNYYQNYVSSVGENQNEESMIEDHMPFLISNRSNIPLDDKKAIFNHSVASRGVEQPDMIGIQLSGNAFIGGGSSIDVTIGYVKDEGLFANASLGAGIGVDLSLSGGLILGNYSGAGKPSSDYLTGGGLFQNGSGGFVSVTTSQAIDNRYRNPFNNSWKTTTLGFVFGSSSLFGGSTGVTITTPPLKFNK